MTRDEALQYIRNGFDDVPQPEPWWHADDGKAFEALLVQLVDDHHVPVDAALGILESAMSATANEFGA